MFISYGTAAADNTPQRCETDFPGLVAWLADLYSRRAIGPKDGPYLSFADYNGGRRSYADLVGSWCVPLDLDLGAFVWAEADIRARLAGRQFIAWTSYSHTPERPRWRIVVAVERAMSADEHRGTWLALAALFNGDAGESSKDATRLNYLPGICAHPEHAQFIAGDGAPFPIAAPVADVGKAGKDELAEAAVDGWNGPTDDDDLIAHMLSQRSSARDAFAAPGTPTKFEALWYADAAALSALYPPREPDQSFDHTAADLALANELAYFTGSHGTRCLELFERSALAQRDSYRQDKGVRAITRACAGRTMHAFTRATSSVASGIVPPADPYTVLVDRTDAGNANLLIQRAGGTLRYVAETRQWLQWSGARWQLDEHEVFVNTRALEVAQHYMNEALRFEREQRPDLKIDSVKWAAKCRNRSTLDNMIVLARKAPGVPISVTELDRTAWLLGVDNGVVDLRTGELREHESREDYVTKRCSVRFNPAATAPRWEQFIGEITGAPVPPVLDASGAVVPGTVGLYVPRPEFAAYLQRALGYSITGLTAEQKMFLAVGPGSNGKNVMFDTVKHLLGAYARTLPSEALMATARPADSERPTALAASLAGARFVLASETKDGQTLDVGLVKNHTGDAEMTARRMRENPFTFSITHKLWISTNNQPNLSQVDAAIRGRLHLIPFERRWNRPSEVVRDPGLPDGDKTLPVQLAREAEGILAWLVRGAVLAQHEGLNPPAEVTSFTSAFIASQDGFARWLATMERCDPKEGTGASALFTTFSQLCVDEGLPARPDNPTAFASALKKYEVPKKQDRTGIKYGLRVKQAPA